MDPNRKRNKWWKEDPDIPILDSDIDHDQDDVDAMNEEFTRTGGIDGQGQNKSHAVE